MLNQDIIREATRLTRAGQLVEATALLQRMLRGERAPDATSRTDGRIALAGREPPTIDAKANVVEETDSRALGASPIRSTAHAPARYSIAQRSAPGSDCEVRSSAPRRPRRTSCRRAQGSSKAPTAIRREAAPTSSSSPAAIRGNRFLWSSCFTAAPSRRTISPPVRG